jgi:dynactin 1
MEREADSKTDAIAELENDVAKSKKQEKVYEDALEQLQAELDSLEAENATLRKTQGSQGTDKSIPITTIQGVSEPVVLGQAGLETAQLLEQVSLAPHSR